jgi:hypothetical protein
MAIRRPTKSWTTDSLTVRQLLASIHDRERALPDFQRDFVWDPDATQELICSVASTYPAGSLLEIRNTGHLLKPREVEGAPAMDGRDPAYLILDGQQRLTSLYQALYGVGEHRYFLRLAEMVEKDEDPTDDFETAIFHLKREKAEKRYGDLEAQAKELVLPLSAVFGEGGFYKWLDRILDKKNLPREEERTLRDRLREVYDTWIKPVEDYPFPIVTLSEKTEMDAVCTIFETLNRRGVKLTVFELLTARFWWKGENLRDRWAQAREEHPEFGEEEFQIDPYYILQAIALMAEDRAPSCKRRDVLKLAPEEGTARWDLAVKALADGLEILRGECGVVARGFLPYETMLYPLAAAWASGQQGKGARYGVNRANLIRWFWCSIFDQVYENAPNAAASKDVGELSRWFGGGEPPESIRGFSFEGHTLRETTNRQRALFRGVLILVLRNGTRDFHRAERITPKLLEEERMDVHHIFPRKFLNDRHPQKCVNSVLNQTLINARTNRTIGGRAPSQYLRLIEKDFEGSPLSLSDVLRSHLISPEAEAAMRRDDFEGFLNARQATLDTEIQKVTRV